MVLWPVPSIFDRPGNGLMGGDGLINTIQNTPKCRFSTQIIKLIHLEMVLWEGMVLYGGGILCDR